MNQSSANQSDVKVITKTKTVPAKLSPTEVPELDLKIPDGFSGETMMITINAPSFNGSFTLTRPIGNSGIPGNSYIVSNPADLKTWKISIENSKSDKADREFEKNCLNLAVECKLFVINEDTLCYNMPGMSRDDTDRNRLLEQAKKKAEADLKEAIKAHEEAEIAEGRDGKFTGRKNAKGFPIKNPKPNAFPSQKRDEYKAFNYLPDWARHAEEAYKDFKKSPSCNAAREKRTAELAKHKSYLGPNQDQPQVEAKCLHNIPAKKIGVVMTKAIKKILMADLPMDLYQEYSN
jgi:hypothetical protein